MSWHDEFDRELALKDIIALFQRLDPGWGARMGALLLYAVKTLLVARRTSFMEIHRILVDDKFRNEQVLPHIRDPIIRQFWSIEYDKLPKDAKSPITVSRMADFLLSESLQTFLGPNPKLNIQEAIESNKTILVSLGAGTAVSDSGIVLGSMLVSKIQQAIFRRVDMAHSDRKPFALYIDEFHNFRTTALNALLTQARGFNLSACLASQHPKQLIDAGIFDDIKGCVSSYVFFQMDSDHARLMRGQIRPHEPEELEHLPVGKALYSMANGNRAIVHTPQPLDRSTASYAEIIRKRTLEKYACPDSSAPDMIHHGDEDEPQPTGRPKHIPSDKRKTRGA